MRDATKPMPLHFYAPASGPVDVKDELRQRPNRLEEGMWSFGARPEGTPEGGRSAGSARSSPPSGVAPSEKLASLLIETRTKAL